MYFMSNYTPRCLPSVYYIFAILNPSSSLEIILGFVWELFQWKLYFGFMVNGNGKNSYGKKRCINGHQRNIFTSDETKEN